jgi:predicted ATPase
MTPVESYQVDLRRGKIRLDAAQAAAVRHTQRLYDEEPRLPCETTSPLTVYLR